MFRVFAYTLSSITLVGGIAWLATEETHQGPHATLSVPLASGLPQDQGSRLTPESVVAIPPHESSLTDSNQDSRLQRFEKQLQLLEEQLRAQRHDLRQQQNEIAQLTRALAMGKPSDPKAVEDSDEPVQSEEEREQIRLAQLDREFAQQKTDLEWSQEAASQIVSTVEKVLNERRPAGGGGTSLVDANCRATLCRIELVGENLEAVNNFSQSFPLQLGWQASTIQIIAHEPDGSVRSIIYVSKDGHDLPAEQGG